MGFDFNHEQRRQLGYKLIDHINQYFDSLPDRPVQLTAEQRTFGQLSDRMPDFGEDATKVLDEMCAEMIDKGFHVPSANYFGLMNPTPTYMAVLAEALVAAINPQLASLARSQLASKIESETVRWIGERIGWAWAGTSSNASSIRCDGTFTSGGNEANLSALAMALAWKFPTLVEDGLASLGVRPVFYSSRESHHSLDKSAGLLGLGRKALRRIGVTDRVQIDLGELEAAVQADIKHGLKPFCIVATAGTTNSGAVDDIDLLSNLAKRYELWLHVDGAYGAAAVFSDKHRDLVRGIDRADSVTIDPHKWLAMPFAAGVVITSHPEMLESTFGVATPYMPKIAGAAIVDNFKVSAQWSRRMNSLKFWLTLRVHGRKAYEELIDRQLELASKFADWIRASDHFELAAPQVLPIVNFRLKGVTSEEEAMALHALIIEQVTRSGERWISQTVVNGRSVLRMMVISYLSEERHLEALERALLAAVRAKASAQP